MSRTSLTRAENDRSDPDTWPWRCLGCGTTLYHDVEFCEDCARPRHRRADRSPPTGFREWISRQSLPSFSLKVTAITGIELALTTFWLQLFLRGPSWLAGLGTLVHP